MAPTTLENMKSSTSPYGRDIKMMGNPLKMTEIVAQLPGTCFVTRQAVHSPTHVRKAKKAIRKAFEYQNLEKGIAFVEIVSNCPSGWKMTPVQANNWMVENMFPFYPLGDLKVPVHRETHHPYGNLSAGDDGDGIPVGFRHLPVYEIVLQLF